MLQLYDQTTFSDAEAGTHGDCNRACVCTLLQIEPALLPHPIAPGGGWNGAYMKALRGRGYTLRTCDHIPLVTKMPNLVDENWGGVVVPRFCMAAGTTERSPDGKVLHAVVYDRIEDRMIHDPHPSRAGLLTITALDYIVPYPAPGAQQQGD